MSPQDDVRRLEHEFAEAMQHLYAVGNGLARLRSDLDGPVAAPAGRAAARPPAAGTVPAAPLPLPVPHPRPAPTPIATPAPPPEPWYRREGAVTRVLAVSGTVVTLAGVAMLLVVAARHGWFGPLARVGAGAALALTLGGLGARQGAVEVARGREVGAAPVALVATGGAAAYLDVVAVTSGHGWLPAGVGLVLSGAVALAGLGLARAWGSELLGVLMVAGAAGLSPLVAGRPGWVLSGFLGILALAGWWAGGETARPVLTVVRSTPVALSLLAGAAVAESTPEQLGLLAVGLVVLLATLATSAVSVVRDPRDAAASAALGTSLAGALVVTADLPDPLRPTVLALTAALLLLAATALGRPPAGPVAAHLVAVCASGGSLAAVLAVLTAAPAGHRTTGLLLLAIGHLAAAVVSRSRVTVTLGAATGLLALAAWARHPIAVVSEATALRHDMATAVLDSLLAGGLAVLAAWASATVRGVGQDLRRASTVLAWAVGSAASATAAVALGVLVGTRLGAAGSGFVVGQATATVAWMLAAGWLLLRSLAGGRYADTALRGGLVLAAVAVAKLFLHDLAALPGLARSVAFIATGLLLIATGSRYARAFEQRRAASS